MIGFTLTAAEKYVLEEAAKDLLRDRADAEARGRMKVRAILAGHGMEDRTGRFHDAEDGSVYFEADPLPGEVLEGKVVSVRNFPMGGEPPADLAFEPVE